MRFFVVAWIIVTVLAYVAARNGLRPRLLPWKRFPLFATTPVNATGHVEYPGPRWWTDLPFQWNSPPTPGSEATEVTVAEDTVAQIRILEFRNMHWGEYRYQEARINGRWTPHGPYVRYRRTGSFTVAFYNAGRRVGSEHEYALDGTWQRAWNYVDGMTDYGRGARIRRPTLVTAPTASPVSSSETAPVTVPAAPL